jgi:hypothetical protein
MLRIAPLALLLIASPAAADEKTFMISGFDRVRVEGPFTVRVTTGTSPKARTVGDARALDGVTVRVSGRTLVVTASVNAWGGYPGGKRETPTVEITAASLRSASVVGGGSLTIDRMTGQRIDLSLAGAGSLSVGKIDADRLSGIMIGTGALTVGGTALDARFEVNGAGTLDAGKLVASALIVNAQGSGDGQFAARNTAEIVASGQGSITVTGDPTCTVRGSAPVTCGRPR